MLRYPRSDGVMLTATLYTPPGYNPKTHGPLPCIVWAYPREFKTKVRKGGACRERPSCAEARASEHALGRCARACLVCDRMRTSQSSPNVAALQLVMSGSRSHTNPVPLPPPPSPLQEAAGQMRRSPHQFTSIGSTSPTLWLTRGYAVLDGPTLPIVADVKVRGGGG